MGTRISTFIEGMLMACKASSQPRSVLTGKASQRVMLQLLAGPGLEAGGSPQPLLRPWGMEGLRQTGGHVSAKITAGRPTMYAQ